MNIVKRRLHFALGPEGTIRSSHLTPALKQGKNSNLHHNRTTRENPQNFTHPLPYTVSKMCLVSKYLPQSHSFALDHQEIETPFSSFSRFHIFISMGKLHYTSQGLLPSNELPLFWYLCWYFSNASLCMQILHLIRCMLECNIEHISNLGAKLL